MSQGPNSPQRRTIRCYSSPPTLGDRASQQSRYIFTINEDDPENGEVNQPTRSLQRVFTVNEDDQHIDSVIGPNKTCGWLIYFFSFLFPVVLKKYTDVKIQALIGFISITVSIVFFCYLFFSFYNECDTKTIETSIKDNKTSCVERLMVHDTSFAIDIKGHWKSDFEGNGNAFGGPWRVSLEAYQANESVFDANIKQMLSTARNLTWKLKNRPFFDVVEGVYFTKNSVNGTQGRATLAAQISIQSIFQNYQMSGFAIVDLASQLKNNWEKNRNPLLQDQNFDLPVGKSFCCSCILVKSDDSECKIRFNSTSIKDGLHVRTPNLTTNELFRDYSLPHIDKREHPKTQSPLEDFKLEYDIIEVFILDYCNKAGQSLCQNLFSSFDFKKGNKTYHTIPRFWGTFNKATSVDYNFLLRSSEVAYIHTLQQFALILEPYQNDNPYPSYLLVPQIHTFKAETQRFGDEFYQVGNKCGNCPLNSSSYDEVLELQRDCQRQVQIYLHLYVMDHLSQESQTFGNNTIEAYTFSFVYLLNSKDEFYYDNFYSQVDHLHCDSSEWAFDEGLSIKPPVMLTTGIYTCNETVCKSTLEKLANAEANVGLLYSCFLIVLLAVFFCIYIGKKEYKKENEEVIQTIAVVVQELQQ